MIHTTTRAYACQSFGDVFFTRNAIGSLGFAAKLLLDTQVHSLDEFRPRHLDALRQVRS